MKTTRLVNGLLLLGLVAGFVSCSGGNHSADEEAPVILTVDVKEGPSDVNIFNNADVAIASMEIKSQPKAPGVNLGPQDDVILTEWVITPVRSDGGTVASPQWREFRNVTVPAGGTANLQNYRIFPAEYFRQQPLLQLYPENGGIDRETGKSNIRQRLQIEIFGKTVAGRRLSVKFSWSLNFYYQLTTQ
ncbi:MAG: hypothetical protein ACUVRY_02595 [Thermoanaerobaculaceae bacterium]